MKRRSFLTLSSATIAALLGGSSLSQCSAVRSGRATLNPTPPLLKSTDGHLSVTLAAQQGWTTVAGQQANLMTYNGQAISPRLEVQAGDTLQIQLINRLSQPTNLHYHGLHVSPTGNSDNPFLHIAPGEQFEYELTLPPHHPAGLFWYHPHLHGYVAEQVFAGLAGLLVVRGELDEIPEVKAATEEFLVLQDFAIDDEGNIPAPHPMWQMWGREGTVLTVNGQLNPTLTVPEQGLLRLRILNASASRIYRLQLQEHPFYLIATDGGHLAEPVELDELILAPGERADVLVRGDRPAGSYSLLTLPYDRGIGGMMGQMESARHPMRSAMGHGHGGHHRDDMMRSLQHIQTQPQRLATVIYGDRTDPIHLPKSLGTVEPLPGAQAQREFILDHGMDVQNGAAFLINGKGFNPNRTDVVAPLNQIEDWTIVNAAGMDHPFHLHVHPFQVVSRNGQLSPFLAWKDTMVKAYEQLKLRVKFTDYPGKAVYHCHILDHEDKGMMGICDVQPS